MRKKALWCRLVTRASLLCRAAHPIHGTEGHSFPALRLATSQVTFTPEYSYHITDIHISCLHNVADFLKVDSFIV